jgi:hypothetical protein
MVQQAKKRSRIIVNDSPAENGWPPSPTDESEQERASRLEQEREAKARSDIIDKAIEIERVERRKASPSYSDSASWFVKYFSAP